MTPSELFQLGEFEIAVATDVGPRVLEFRRIGGESIFAHLPTHVLEREKGEPFSLLGGHRLWLAPESPDTTYSPDSHDVTHDVTERNIVIRAGPDEIGLVKELELAVDDEGVRVDHRLVNEGPRTISGAAWAITQLVPGGMAALPQNLQPADPHGLCANRSIVLWPYTDPGSPSIVWAREHLIIDTAVAETALKIGQPNQVGYLAYALDGLLFVKWSTLHRRDATYPDMGASAQVYVSGDFVELETVGRMVEMEPGSGTTHTEHWRLAEYPPDQDFGQTLAR